MFFEVAKLFFFFCFRVHNIYTLGTIFISTEIDVDIIKWIKFGGINIAKVISKFSLRSLSKNGFSELKHNFKKFQEFKVTSNEMCIL